jgi:hypothetical protein
VPIRGFTRSAGSVDFVVEMFCPAGAQADRKMKRIGKSLIAKNETKYKEIIASSQKSQQF